MFRNKSFFAMSSLCKTWKPEYNWTQWLPELGVYFHFLHFMCFNVCFSGPYSRYLLFTFYCWGVNNTKCEGKVLKIVLLLLLCIVVVIQHIFQMWGPIHPGTKDFTWHLLKIITEGLPDTGLKLSCISVCLLLIIIHW